MSRFGSKWAVVTDFKFRSRKITKESFFYKFVSKLTKRDCIVNKKRVEKSLGGKFKL